MEGNWMMEDDDGGSGQKSWRTSCSRVAWVGRGGPNLASARDSNFNKTTYTCDYYLFF